ncbi:uncharacterized protein ACLA_028960 [Aspergillus clavatus NRRL 1]|uniref:Uncharacterized protein n=1 Tax=Aspergillus clavatus (strain ATCC 1007 / CBS 513.65 / DSM 816 / NCTC 3887 / NRRL 1 / QM 1276 / 107) TaxID=344612 RepID=A1CR99_ASPCL|nr:uncharacterized protein ACLA_028960 [Aspergillus clavatus NRRL 1]EAW08170.1 conserved hypothetical protein [Aspergillus clavatus NRRL 1]
MNQLPLSPPAEPTPPSPISQPVALDSPIRSVPIHESLPSIRVPSELKPYQYNPVTCTPLDLDDVSVRAQLSQLREEYPSPEAALKAQEQIAKEVQRKLEEAEKKREEVQKAIDKKVKERNTEMKVLSKYQEVKASEIPAEGLQSALAYLGREGSEECAAIVRRNRLQESLCRRLRPFLGIGFAVQGEPVAWVSRQYGALIIMTLA